MHDQPKTATQATARGAGPPSWRSVVPRQACRPVAPIIWTHAEARHVDVSTHPPDSNVDDEPPAVGQPTSPPRKRAQFCLAARPQHCWQTSTTVERARLRLRVRLLALTREVRSSPTPFTPTQAPIHALPAARELSFVTGLGAVVASLASLSALGAAVNTTLLCELHLPAGPQAGSLRTTKGPGGTSTLWWCG